MVYYKGGVTYSELQAMPIPELLELSEHAHSINQEIEQAQKRASRK